METRDDFFEDARAATLRLLAVAQQDTDQSEICARFLLAWWNPKLCGGFPLIDAWAVSGGLKQDMLTVFRFLVEYWRYPTAFGLDQKFEDLVQQWHR